MQLQSLSRSELEQLTTSLLWDQHIGYMLGSVAAVLHKHIAPNRVLLFVDFCNVHACNHFFGSLDATNQRWIRCFETRESDLIIKWGGDEIVILLDDPDVDGYLTRMTAAMRENDVYAVIGVVRTSDLLTESILRADKIVNRMKKELEDTGKKPHRDEPYVCLDSYIVYE